MFGIELFKSGPKVLYDFAQHGIVTVTSLGIELAASYTTVGGTPMLAEAKTIKEEKDRLTPKRLFQLKALNDNNFVINTQKQYLEKQIALVKEKIKLLPEPKKRKLRQEPMMEFGAVKYGREELKSILERLYNRYKINNFKKELSKYPHTTSELISNVLKENKHLRCKCADEFVPDLPRAAIKVIKEYNNICKKVCNKTTNFYVIAKQEDFEKVQKRRDPILLAQSPFGHFWQILGAWDKEMVYLADL